MYMYVDSRKKNLGGWSSFLFTPIKAYHTAVLQDVHGIGYGYTQRVGSVFGTLL